MSSLEYEKSFKRIKYELIYYLLVDYSFNVIIRERNISYYLLVVIREYNISLSQ